MTAPTPTLSPNFILSNSTFSFTSKMRKKYIVNFDSPTGTKLDAINHQESCFLRLIAFCIFCPQGRGGLPCSCCLGPVNLGSNYCNVSSETNRAGSEWPYDVFMIENGSEYFYFLRIISLLIIILTRDKDVDQARRSTSRQCSLVNTIRYQIKISTIYEWAL